MVTRVELVEFPPNPSSHMDTSSLMTDEHLVHPRTGEGVLISRVGMAALGQEHRKALTHENVFLPEPFSSANCNSGLSNVEVVEFKTRDGRKQDKYPERDHYLMVATIDDRRHVWWYSDALLGCVTDSEPIVVFSKPGLGEIVEKGLGWIHHKQLSRQMPLASIVTHATYGIGPLGQELSWSDLLDHDMKQLVEHERRFLETFFPNSPLMLVGVSEGTIENHGVALYNLEHGSPLEIQAIVDYAHALVDPRNVAKDMAFLFMPHMGIDGVKELILKTRPKHLIGALKMLGASGPRSQDLRVMGRQGLSIMRGTPEDEQREVIEHIPKVVISGSNDPLLQLDMLSRMQKDLPEQISVDVLEGRGHGMALKPFAGGRRIAHQATRLGLRVANPELSLVKN